MSDRPTQRDIDALWGPATPQFAYQIANRMAEMVAGLPPGDPVRLYAQERLSELDHLGHGSSKGEEAAH
jgi:hypothetical protein